MQKPLKVTSAVFLDFPVFLCYSFFEGHIILNIVHCFCAFIPVYASEHW